MNRRSFIKNSVITGITGTVAANSFAGIYPQEAAYEGAKTAAGSQLSFNSNGKFKILQIADTHYVAGNPRSERALKNVIQMLDLEKPDLVVHTGDVVYGKPAEASAREILDPMAQRKIPFIVTFGNHDEEFDKTRKEMLDIVMSIPYNLNTKNEDIYGETNSVLTLFSPKAGKIGRVFYFLDSNRSSTIKDIPKSYGHIHFDQIAWYRSQSEAFTKMNGDTPIPSFAFFHIPLPEHKEATFDDLNGKTIGTRRELIACSKINSGVFVSMKEMRDVEAIFVGHDHNNDYVTYWNKMLFFFGRFSGCDTVYNDLKPNGARVIELTEGEEGFRSWVRLYGSGTIQDHQYPDVFL